MLELREDQLQDLAATEQPSVAVDPSPGQEYLLTRRELYQQVCAFLKPLGHAWNNPADDDQIREGA